MGDKPTGRVHVLGVSGLVLLLVATLAAQGGRPPAIQNRGVAVFAPRVDRQLSLLGLNAPKARAKFTIHPLLEKFSAVTMMDEASYAGVLECETGAKGADALQLEESADHKIISVSCPGASFSDGQHAPVRGAHTLAIGYRKTAFARVFSAPVAAASNEASVRSRVIGAAAAPRAAPVAPASPVSKDEQELANCVDAFRRYKTDPSVHYFRASFAARVYHCDASSSRQAWALDRSGVFQAARLGVKPTAIPGPVNLGIKQVSQDAINPDVPYVPPIVTTYVPSFPITHNSLHDGPPKIRVGPIDPNASWVMTFRFEMPSRPAYTNVMLQIYGDRAGMSLGCAGWEHSPDMIQQTIVTPEMTAIRRGAGQPWQGLIYVGWKMFADTFPFVDDAVRRVRIVPVRKAPNGGWECAATPSNRVTVTLHDNGPEEKRQAEQLALETQMHAQAVGPDARAHSPITVQVLSYVAPLDFLTGAMVKDDRGFLCTRHPVSGLGNYGYPYNTFPAGCAYAAEDVFMASKTQADEGALEAAWDGLINVLDSYAQVFDLLKSFAVDSVLFTLSGGHCAVGDPNSCPEVKKGGAIAVNIALAALGYPPTLPTAAALAGQGKDYLVETLADAIVTEVPGGDLALALGAEATTEGLRLAADKLARATVDKMLQQASCLPTPLASSPLIKTVTDENGCTVVPGELISSSTFNPVLLSRPPVLYLKVTPNAAGLKFSGTQTIRISDEAQMFQDAFVQLTVSRIPAQGFVIPVTLQPNVNKYANSKSADCGPGCTDVTAMETLWNAAANGSVPARLNVLSSFLWTDQPLKTLKSLEMVVWTPSAYAVVVRANSGTYGVPAAPPACPGFGYTYTGSQITGIAWDGKK